MWISNETGEASREGLITRGRSWEKDFANRGTSRSKSKDKNLICDYRKNKGDIKADCFKLKDKEQQKNNDAKNQDKKSTNIQVEASVAAGELDGSDIYLHGYK